jgi:hypothetical protein
VAGAGAAAITAVTNRDLNGAVVKDGSRNYVPSAAACYQQCKATQGCNLWVWCSSTEGCGGSDGVEKSK